MDTQIETGALVGIVYILIKVIEKVILKVISSKDPAPEKAKDKLDDVITILNDIKAQKDHNLDEMVRTLYDWHNKSDQDGVKLWYVPRSWYLILKDVVDTTATVNTTQNQLIGQIEKLAGRIENIEREVMISSRNKIP